MIQDIGAFRYHNEYRDCAPEADSRILCYRGREVFAAVRDGSLDFLTYQEFCEGVAGGAVRYTYLFAIDRVSFFLATGQSLAEELAAAAFPDFAWHPIEIFRAAVPREAAFAAVTGYQLAAWYDSRRFCPRCGRPMVHDARERMMRCDACRLTEYPKICPAVIVGVTEGDRLLLTRYAGGDYRKYALIAGFTEIGESVEETVRREVMEEVGLRVRNIRYYKSQPWSYTSTLLMGFFCEVDGADEIHLDRMELSEAKWCTREEIPEDDGVSLTREMMRVFKEGGLLLS